MNDRKPCPIPGPLRRRWHWTAILFALALATSLVLLHPVLAPAHRVRWGVQSLVTAVIVLALFRRYLPLNLAVAGGVPRNALGTANGLTLLRGLLLSLLAGFIGLPWGSGRSAPLLWIPGALYLTAALLDGLDGAVARRGGLETLMGAQLDTAFDALGIALATLLLVAGAKAPGAYLAVGAVYYLFQAGLAWRRRRGLPLVAVAPWKGARLLAGFQMGFAGAALLPLFSPTVTRMAAWVMMVPFLAGFLRDWLIATARIGTDAAQRCRLEKAFAPLVNDWLPPLLRLSLLPTLLLQPEKFPGSAICLPLALAAAGFLGRLSAIGLAVVWGVALSASPSHDLWRRAPLLLTLILMMTGSGRFSLWQPEERWLSRRAGAETF